MSTPSLQVQSAVNDKAMSGEGDGFKQITSIRHPVPSSRKFTPTLRKTNNMKSKLEAALKEMKTPNKTQGLRVKLRTECSSVDSPLRIPNRKCLKTAENDKIKIYCSPREFKGSEKFPEGAARLVLGFLLLNSWRKCRTRYHELSSLLTLKEEKINQLNMQIEVLLNLRKSESSRREDISKKYNEIQREFDEIIQQNIALRNHIECLDRDKSSIISELEKLNQKTKYYKEEIEEKTNLLHAQTERFEAETEKVKKLTAEKKQTREQNHKMKNMINVQKENVENLKTCVETLQKSKLELNSKFEKVQESCRTYSEQLRSLTLENAVNKSKIATYETEKEEMCKELKSLKTQLEVAVNNCNELRKANDSIQLEIVDISRKYEDEKKMVWIWVKRGVNSTYSVLKFLAEKIVPALHTNFTC